MPRELTPEVMGRAAPEQVARVVVALVVHEHIASVRFAAQPQALDARAAVQAVEELAAHLL